MSKKNKFKPVIKLSSLKQLGRLEGLAIPDDKPQEIRNEKQKV